MIRGSNVFKFKFLQFSTAVTSLSAERRKDPPLMPIRMATSFEALQTKRNISSLINIFFEYTMKK